MSEYKDASARRLFSLSRYISALEQGDIETLAAVLHEASADPVLNALLEELDGVYQALDGAAVSAEEARQISQRIFSSSQNGHLAREQESTLARYTPDRHVTPLPDVLPSYERKRQKIFMEEQLIQPFHSIQHLRSTPERSLPRRHLWQLFAALLIVCTLVGSMVLALHQLRPGTGPGTNVNPSPGLPAAQQQGTTVYTKPLNAIFSNAASIAWSPDGRRIAGLTFDGVQIWDATTGAHWMISKAPDNFGILQNISWSPNGRWIAVAAETGVAVIDAQTGALVHGYALTGLPTSSLVSLTGSSGSYLDALFPASGGGSSVSSVVWSPDSRQLAITDYSTANGNDNFLIINAQTGSLVHNFTLPSYAGIVVANWSPDGRYLATSVTTTTSGTGGASLLVWSTSTYQSVLQHSTNGGGGSPIMPGEFAWQPGTDNLLFAEGNLSNLRYGWVAPTIVLWNVPQNRLLKQYSFENTGDFTWSPDGRYFATGSYANQPITDQSVADQVAIIDARNGRQVYVYNQNDYQVLDIAWSPDGRYIASCGQSSVKVWVAR